MTREAKTVLDERARNIDAWLSEHAPDIKDEQDHLDEGSRERAYWHYGYMIALRDVLALLTDGKPLD